MPVSVAALARRLDPEIDFDTDEYGHNIFLTEAGSARVERFLSRDNLYDLRVVVVPPHNRCVRVVELEGLYVIGTNRHESRRIDRQLRGRAGRQGDPGSSRFFVSLEDPLIQRYGVGKLIGARVLPARQDSPADSPVLAHEISRAQRIIEGESFDTRRRLWELSAVVETQRQSLQGWRQEVLLGETRPGLLEDRCPERWLGLCESCGRTLLEEVERRLVLIVTDRCWSDHLADLRRIRDGIHVVGFVGRDPASEFFREAGEAFADLHETITAEA